ncbi:MAG: hypothetical protein QM784_10970 [Polyangiaceae bacterium]
MMDRQNRGRIRTLSFTAWAFALLATNAAYAQTTTTPVPASDPTTAPPSSAGLAATSEDAAVAPAAAPAPTPAVEAAPPAVKLDASTAPVAMPDSPKAAADATAALSEEERSWFYRPSLTTTFGKGDKALSVTFYGFVQADAMYDTTRSYDDHIGDALVAHGETYAGKQGRMQFSSRNSRIGMQLQSNPFAGVKTLAVFEMDFFGEQAEPHPATPTNSEYAATNSSEKVFFANPIPRLRHAYGLIQTDYVDILAGQTYDVFGWQSYFFPCSVQYLGLPNQVFSRNTQFRLSHLFGSTGPIGVEVAAAALRPAQRDGEMPDLNAGVRFAVNGVKGITTPGNTGTTAQPLSLGVSGTMRKFRLNAFTPPPSQKSNAIQGWGLSVDALVPVIPAKSAVDRSNKLTLTGSFVMGSGIGDLINATGGATFPTLPNPAQANPPPIYSPNVDDGLVTFDTAGVAHTIDWKAFRAGLQYYLPPGGRFIFAANYTQAYSKNMGDLFPKGGAEVGLLVKIADLSRYADANLFFDATPAMRFGVSGQYSYVEYLDGNKPHNVRGMAQALYAF